VSCFTEVLRLCAEAGLVRIGTVALDGTKILTNASLRANRSKASIDAEVAAILDEAAAADECEDDTLGEGVRGEELPEGMRASQGRLARLAECKARLQAQDVATAHEAELRRREVVAKQTGRKPVGRPPNSASPPRTPWSRTRPIRTRG
jgi:hypothetical protein